MSNYPSTKRFSIHRDPNRRGIDNKPSPVCEIMYGEKEFGHTWQVKDSHPLMTDVNGKWTFNRSTVAIENEWWPKNYYHNTLEDLLNHLEETFVEGVPQRPPNYMLDNS